ncbi:MAG TPA: hypothetical protein VJR29_13860 [bacterium]|nr:hypothetical protein [bacterium]
MGAYAKGCLLFLCFALFAGCGNDSPAPTDETPVLKASTGSFAVDGQGMVRLSLAGIQGKAVSADGSQSVGTAEFLNAYPFSADSPSPAGLVFGSNRQRIDLMLANPIYDSANANLQFDVSGVDPQGLPPSIDTVELRLESCPDQNYVCAWSDITVCDSSIGPVGTCWQWLSLSCDPCDCSADIQLCAEANPQCCPDHGGCLPAKIVPPPQGLQRYCL